MKKLMVSQSLFDFPLICEIKNVVNNFMNKNVVNNIMKMAFFQKTIHDFMESTIEKTRINDAWDNVSEHFLPFNLKYCVFKFGI